MHTRLHFLFKDITFDFVPRGTFNQICGDSASGKSFFFASLKEFVGRPVLPGLPRHSVSVDGEEGKSLTVVNGGKVAFIDYQSTDYMIDDVLTKSGFVVCIDNADIINMIYPDLSAKLRKNPSNMYILAGRGFYGLFIPERDRQFPQFDRDAKTFTFCYREDLP